METLRTPRAAAVAGILFSLLLGVALTLITLASPERPATVGTWLTDSSRRAELTVALKLVPFAGIAFLWFIGVVRDRIGQREDRFSRCCSLGPPSPAGWSPTSRCAPVPSGGAALQR